MGIKTFWWSVGLFSIALSIWFLFDQSFLFYLVKHSLSPDNHLTTAGEEMVRRTAHYFCAWGFLFGVLAFDLTRPATRDRLHRRIFSDRVGERTITRPGAVMTLYVLIYLPVLTLGILHYYTSWDFTYFFAEDHVFETLTAVTFVACAMIFFYAAHKSRHVAGKGLARTKHILVSMNIATGLLFFGIGMEEISWGQRIFNIAAPTDIASGNYQSELNIHNYFNPYRVVINRTVASVMLLTLLLGWFRRSTAESWFFDYWFPHASFIFLSFMFVVIGGVLENEMFEELVAVFVAFYSYRTYRIYREV